MSSEKEKGSKSRKEKIIREITRYWINVLYLSVIFSVFFNYQRLILAHYEIRFGDYGIGIIKALVLAKVILIADAIGLGRRWEDKPLIVPTLFKTLLFTLFVGLFSIIESMIRGLLTGKGPINEVMGMLSYVLLAHVIVVFVTFIPYFAFRELGRVMGGGQLRAL
ncbi:MAG TPA: hypothetical protein PLA18_12740, partial [Deltaproteobacteria bacterium]|nr:hypothetical protein [Deltaproteobacteria bacterium]